MRRIVSLHSQAMAPTLRQSHHLIALSDRASFTPGAAAVGVSQPSLSQQKQLVEAHLGGQVVKRGSKKAFLSPLGREASAAARRVLAEVAAFNALGSRRADALSGTIRLGISPTFGP